ncbi:hypothetical protein SCUCBS95973_008746 [Sporothrix curviconia]|uniref:DUF2428 domain-containing protein n=1 Tax=Sporothrix curviconia TaxID=1260050 RepID=A0ABP0CQL8_9PEZI
MSLPQLPDIEEASANANTLFAWLEQQPKEQSQELAEALFVQLLANSAKSRVSSVNACAKLCGFVQHCATRPAEAGSLERQPNPATEWAFQASTTLRLFHFYIEWNEKDQHRSLKLVLDLVALLVVQNPNGPTRTALRDEILQTLVAIISRKSTRPLVKSSFGSLHYLLGKGVYQFEEVARAYSREMGDDAATASQPSLAVWQRLVADMFAWMTLHYVCPVAGKFLVAVFTYLQTAASETDPPLFAEFTVERWLQWLRNGLSAHPTILEDVKLYFFIPFFKTDRARSLQLLEILNKNQLSTTIAESETAGASKGFDAALLQLAALEVGKKAGLVDDPGLNLAGKPAKGGVIVLNESVLDGVLARAPADVRSLALSLLVSSQSTTKPYSETAFALLRRYLPTYHAESDAKFRYELLAHTRDMTVRLKSAILTMQRWGRVDADAPSKASSKKKDRVLIDEAVIQNTLAQHEDFLTWYLTFLRAELAPTASYQRHFTSLKATSWLLRQRRDVSGGVSDALDAGLVQRLFKDKAWVRCVLDLVMDPFDDVRETATSLLVLAPPELVAAPENPLQDVLVEFSKLADQRASQTARQDHADGAARCQGLMTSWAAADLAAQKAILSQVLGVLEDKIVRAERDLGSAAVQSPVHGEFASIKYIWAVLAKAKYSDADLTDLVAIQARIVNNCERVWHIVKHVLCDDSPEGHIPEDLEDGGGVSNLDSKDLLSYSFRSINESSNTMRAIVMHLRFSRVRGTLTPDRPVFERIGNLAFEQLSTLRHRGALTTVAQTFTLCCQLAQDPMVTAPGTPQDETLVSIWYKGTLDCIRSQVSTTRRSAGIPALFSGIFASSNTSHPAFFYDAIRTACTIAQEPVDFAGRAADGSRLPQVHAFNCLRDVFRSSLLSKRAERLLPECLQLAANSLRSDVWAIRNCGLLLLRSLIDCLFGTGESKASLESGWDGRTIRISYNKYPTLPGVLLSLLKTGSAPDAVAFASASDRGHLQIESQQAAAESVFPALDIIRRAGPPESHRTELYDAVVPYLGSHLWHVREMAARTVCSFLVVDADWVAGVQRLLLDKVALASANRWHGSLLAVRFVLGRVASVSGDSIPDSLLPLLTLLDTLAESNDGFVACPEVRAAYLEARVTIAQLSLQFKVDLGEAIAKILSTKANDTSVPSALLTAQAVLQANYTALVQHDRKGLESLVGSVAVSDPDTGTRLLEEIQSSWFATSNQTLDTASWLCSVYMNICLEIAAAPEVRAVALLNLADALDCILLSEESDNALLPTVDALGRVWSATSQGAINPTLSWAILHSSGPILAASVRLESTMTSLLSVSAWAAMIKTAVEPAQTFDTRMAAAEALRSFALATASTLSPPLSKEDSLPFASCMYDALNDDDDEIRDVAAKAASAVLGTPLIPGEAARQLPLWMADQYGGVKEASSIASASFGLQVAARVEGQSSGGPVSAWPTASSLLASALEFDDALFLVEEHNLYVDEVREAERWAAVLGRCNGVAGLDVWLVDGMEALVSRIRSPGGGDGPLGWAAAPSVFAVCSRLIIGARAVVHSQSKEGETSASVQRLLTLLATFEEAGEKARVHGLLLAMAKA